MNKQARALKAMQHSLEQGQEQVVRSTKKDREQDAAKAAQERRSDNDEMKQWMWTLFGKQGSFPTTLDIPPTSKRSRDTSTLTQSTYETSNLTEEIQAKRSIGKAPKTPKPRPETETIDFPPDEEPIDYVMNGMPQDYGQYPDFRDDPESHDQQL